MASKRKLNLGDVQGPGDKARIDARGSVRLPRERVRQQRFQPGTELFDFRGLSRTINQVAEIAGQHIKEAKKQEATDSGEEFFRVAQDGEADIQRDVDDPSIFDTSTYTKVPEDQKAEPGEHPGLIGPQQPVLPEELAEGQLAVAALSKTGVVSAIGLKQLDRYVGTMAATRGMALLHNSLRAEPNWSNMTTYDPLTKTAKVPFEQLYRSIGQEILQNERFTTDKDARDSFINRAIPMVESLRAEANKALRKSHTDVLGAEFIAGGVDAINEGLSPLITQVETQGDTDRQVKSLVDYFTENNDTVHLRSGWPGSVTPTKRENGLYIDTVLQAAKQLEADQDFTPAEKRRRAQLMLDFSGEVILGTVKARKHSAYRQVEDALLKIVNKPRVLPGSGSGSDFWGEVREDFADDFQAFTKVLVEGNDADTAAAKQDILAKAARVAGSDGGKAYEGGDFSDYVAEVAGQLNAMERPFEGVQQDTAKAKFHQIAEMIRTNQLGAAQSELGKSAKVLTPDLMETLSNMMIERGRSDDLLKGSDFDQLNAAHLAADAELRNSGLPSEVIREGLKKSAKAWGVLKDALRGTANRAKSKNEIPKDAVNEAIGSQTFAQAQEQASRHTREPLKAKEEMEAEMNVRLSQKHALSPEEAAALPGIVGSASARNLIERLESATNPGRILDQDLRKENQAANLAFRRKVLEFAADKELSEASTKRLVDISQEEFEAGKVAAIKVETGAGGADWKKRILTGLETSFETALGNLSSNAQRLKLKDEIQGIASVVKQAHKVVAKEKQPTREEFSENLPNMVHVSPGLAPFLTTDVAIPGISEFARANYLDAYSSYLTSGVYKDLPKDVTRRIRMFDQVELGVLTSIRASEVSEEAKTQLAYELHQRSGQFYVEDFARGKRTVVEVTREGQDIQTKAFDLTKVEAQPWAGPMFETVKDAKAFANNPEAVYQKLPDGRTMAEVLGFTITEGTAPLPGDPTNPETELFRSWIRFQVRIIPIHSVRLSGREVNK